MRKAESRRENNKEMEGSQGEPVPKEKKGRKRKDCDKERDGGEGLPTTKRRKPLCLLGTGDKEKPTGTPCPRPKARVKSKATVKDSNAAKQPSKPTETTEPAPLSHKAKACQTLMTPTSRLYARHGFSNANTRTRRCMT